MPLTKFLLMSDTHNDYFPAPASLPQVDVLLHAGDLTQIGGISSFKRAISALDQVQAELKLVIAGNHDVSLDAKWWAENLDEDEDNPNEPAHALQLFEDAKARGIHLLQEGTHHFTLSNGSSFTIYASPYTPAFNGYAFSYGPDEDRFNPNPAALTPIPGGVDIVMTHGPPKLDDLYANYNLDINHLGEHCGCPKLAEALQRVRPKLHCFGHLHEGYGAASIRLSGQELIVNEPPLERKPGHAEIAAPVIGKNDGLLINAALQDEEDQRGSVPWVVSLGLSEAKGA